MRPTALGIHVFAGGFTMGVRDSGFDVPAQLEIHGLGRETVEKHLTGTEFVNAPDWEEWPDPPPGCRFCYGNPRCTGFSCVTGGLGAQAHGPWAKCTKDVHDLCRYGVGHGLDLVIWESVQPAYTVGRPLLDHLRDEYFAPAGYRIAHVFLNAATFGNAQLRRRYFFVGYRGGNFNVEAPPLPDRMTLVSDVLSHPYLAERTPRPHKWGRNGEYDPDSCSALKPEEAALAAYIPEKCDLNAFARRYPERMRDVAPRLWQKWLDRSSDMPFSMHCTRRIRWHHPCPTLASSCRNFVHPRQDRTLTVREVARLMGWPEDVCPVGPNPTGQVAKGVCPEVGEWLGRQAQAFLGGGWGRDDWSTRWRPGLGWVGTDHTGSAEPPLEKVMHLGDYLPPLVVPDDETQRKETECSTT